MGKNLYEVIRNRDTDLVLPSAGKAYVGRKALVLEVNGDSECKNKIKKDSNHICTAFLHKNKNLGSFFFKIIFIAGHFVPLTVQRLRR